MKRTRSITARLAGVFLLLFLTVALLGTFSIVSLSSFDRLSSRVRDEWLPATGLLGDLNNHTSDFRGLEAAVLLATPEDRPRATRDIEELDETIRAVERRYARLPRDGAEDELYARFSADWERYRALVRQNQTLVGASDRARAVELYNSASKDAYDNASHSLDLLTARNVSDASAAAAREEQAYQRAWRLIVATIVLAGLAVVGAMLYVRRFVSLPILDLASRMHRLAANDTGVDVGGTERDDEIGEMARAVVVFRANAIELVNSRYGLEQQATMLKERLAEEQRITQVQRNLVSMASHEFRTPVTIIDGHAQRLIALKDQLTPAVVAERAQRIRSAADRITQLIAGLIDSSRLVDGDVQLYFHPLAVDVVPLLAEVCQLQRGITPGVQILESFPSESLELHADPNLLYQMFSNLLANAIKYSPDGGLIRVTLSSEPTAAIVTIDDRGIGIPDADRDHLFERYYRGSNTAGIVGTGLGLYLVKTVVELHGGSVAAEKRPGGGSRFTVRLPRARPSPAATARLAAADA